MVANDKWKSLHQVLPINVYERWLIQIKRVARANGISVDGFEKDDKFNESIGPRVMTYEALLVLMERTEEDATFRV